ncbi:Crp/Fnr family transcriptional regulator [Myroides odoratimimus]|uniref:Crp/Fnr family transcriptional regulator n=1 Tax=Myroides odoratimimus TaxID=76832 RepID=UPI002DBC2BC8|nr:Crp/Fnr family transcriptional regulator [Myroides odoratimimus]MEC4054109.1 Crp/Fnr family transcriptional regulator [Myroides odoratimimus]
MQNKLIDYIKTYTPLTFQEEEHLISHIVYRSYAKQEILFQEGNVSNEIYFVTKGCVRLYYNVNEIDKTGFFYTEGQFICAGESFTYKVEASENYQVLEDTELCVLTRENIESLLKLSPVFEIIARIAVENELLTAQRIIRSFVTQSAEERYKELLAHQGELFLRVPQQYIATFLGVSPETLSRIKARVLTQIK